MHLSDASSRESIRVAPNSDNGEVPNNRHWALLIWVAIAFAWALTKPDIRRSIGGVFRVLLSLKFLLILLGYLGVIRLVIWGAAQVGAWDPSLAADSVAWLFISGWALFASFAAVDSRPDFFTTHLREIVGVSLVLEFVIDFAVLPLVFELLIIPLLVIVGAGQALAQSDKRLASVAGLLSGCLTLLVLSMAAFGVFMLVDGWSSLNWASIGRQFALPIWLTIAVLPYVYIVGIATAYGQFFRRLDSQSTQGWWRRFVSKLALVVRFGPRGYDLGRLGSGAYYGLAHAKSWGDARKAIADQMREDDERRAEAQRAAERLERYAGVAGVGSDGRRLDQREFEETKAALRWLHTCHQGWWQRQSRYKQGLLGLIGSASQMHGLDPANGYQEWVSPDGSSWFGWRRTVTGWVFAIGANAEPPNQWTYDGPEAPTGPPGIDSSWGHEPFSESAAPNW